MHGWDVIFEGAVHYFLFLQCILRISNKSFSFLQIAAIKQCPLNISKKIFQLPQKYPFSRSTVLGHPMLNDFTAEQKREILNINFK